MARERARRTAIRQRATCARLRYTARVTELVLVRHAETVWNAEGRWQGQTDVPLSERGRGEVARVAERLRSERFDRVVASDLVRAHDTARGIAAQAPITLEPALREMHLGAWCGLLHGEVVRRYPDELLALQRGDGTRIGGDGETVVELGARVVAAMDRIARESEGQKVLVVTHGGVIRALMLDMLGLSGPARPLFGSRNTAITRVRIENGARLLRSYNDARHLVHEPLEGEERMLGASARDAIGELLGIRDRSVLATPADDAESCVVGAKRQLVSYALDPR
jgi:broad specificity phosphatase PhoE